MADRIRPSLLAASIALVLLASGTATAETKASQEIIDARQESQILTTFSLVPYFRSRELSVYVHEGKATLSGRVDEEIVKDFAKQIAFGVNGIKEVDNKIVVDLEYVSPERNTQRSYGDLIDDVSLSTTVKSKLLWSKHADGLTTEVETVAGKVTLRGVADSPAAKELAGRLALNTRGVVEVDNRLEVKNKTPTIADKAKQSVKVAEKDIADSWITAKVMSTLLYSSNVDSSKISVHTKGGVVTLSGKLHSGAERALAIELAQHVRGVKSVYSNALKH